jgi:serine/threonine protein phosphatase PrpC
MPYTSAKNHVAPPVGAPTLQVDACTASHIGDRADQQDRVALLSSQARPGKVLAVLADGMGGRTGGQMASEQVIATARSLFNEAPTRDQGARQLLDQITAEAHAVIKLGALSSQLEPHSTIIALLVDRHRADWAHAGDSRLYFFREGVLQHCTRDHSCDPQQATADASAPAQSRHKNVLYSAMGIRLPLQVDHGNTDASRAGDAYLLASDGLWAYFSVDELASIVSGHRARAGAERLIQMARERAAGRGDNLSLAIIKLEHAEKTSPAQHR